MVMSLLITPAVRKLSFWIGAVDRPDCERKRHLQPTARLGGVAIWISFIAGAAMVVAGTRSDWDLTERIAGVVASGSIVFLTGLADDLYDLRPRWKLLAEGAAAFLFWWMLLHRVHTGPTDAGHWWFAPLTVLWVVACTNAFNLIDGVDGLAAGLALIGAVAVLIAALLRGDVLLAMIVAPLLGALLGFLVFNFHPASIFLGDSGSLHIGFLLGCCTVLWAQRYHTTLGATGPLVALAIPILDTGLAVLRRFLRSRPIFSADRGHMHHRLLDRGLPAPHVALTLYAGGALACITSILHQQLTPPYNQLVLILFGTGTLAALRFFRFTEIPAMAHFLLKGVLRHVMNAQIELWNFESSLSAATTLEECRAVIREEGRAFGILALNVRISGEVWDERLRDSPEEACWRIHVPLSGSDYMEVIHSRQNAGLDMIGCFIEVVCRELQARVLTQYAEASIGPWAPNRIQHLGAKAGS
jgi:UDP-GlcNAc:undecaprenyl-phosphate GlcNAc-1-phosphate transferase